MTTSVPNKEQNTYYIDNMIVTPLALQIINYTNWGKVWKVWIILWKKSTTL